MSTTGPRPRPTWFPIGGPGAGGEGGAVDSVNTETGDVVLDAADVGAAEETHAAQHQHGGADEVATATPGNNAIPKAGGSGTLAAGWLPAATTSAAGAVELATDGEVAANVVAQGNDARLAKALIAYDLAILAL